MFMSIRTYRVGPGQRDEVVRKVDEGWTDELRRLQGFVSYHVVASGENELVSVTTCIDEDSLSQAVFKSGEWVGGHLMELDVQLIDTKQGRVASHVGG